MKILPETTGSGGGGAPSGAAGGDLSGTYPNPGVANVQGVAQTAATATITSQLNAATTRNTSTLPATAAAGEETVLTGSTAAGTLTLPASTTQASTQNSVLNLSSVSVTVAAGSGTTLNYMGTVGSVTLVANAGLQAILIGTVWYVTGATFTTAGGDLTGTYPNPTLAAAGGGAAGPLGSATVSPIVTVDAKGRVTALTSATIVPTNAAGGDLSGNYPNPTVAALAITDAKVATAAAIAVTKLADPGTGKVIGSVSNAAAAVRPPGYEWDYVQITTGIAVTATSEGTSTIVIVGNAVTFDGAPVILEVFSPRVFTDTNAAADLIFFTLFESGSSIARLGEMKTVVTAAPVTQSYHSVYRFTPSAGAHTYSIGAFVSSNTGTPKFDAGASGNGNLVPAFYRITKV